MTRSRISLISALALIVAGVIGLIYVLFFSAATPLTIAGASQVVLCIGVVWLYSDDLDVTSDDQRSSRH